MTQERPDEADGNPRLSDRTAGVKEKLGHTLELRFARQTGQTTAEGFIIVPHRITALRLPVQA